MATRLNSQALTITRTDSDDRGFQSLVRRLDEELAIRDGHEHDYYAQFNTITALKNVVVLAVENEPVACGAFKRFESDVPTVECKRMFVLREWRRRGLAERVLKELEQWAVQEGYRRMVLETGLRLPEAVGLYRKAGFVIIPNYGQYVGIANSVCMQKDLQG